MQINIRGESLWWTSEILPGTPERTLNIADFTMTYHREHLYERFLINCTFSLYLARFWVKIGGIGTSLAPNGNKHGLERKFEQVVQ